MLHALWLPEITIRQGHPMFMRVLAPCYYFSHDLAELIYTFSKYSRTWNYTILRRPDRSENRWVSAYTIFMRCPKQKAASRK
jgi:hypothetical protein